MIDSLFLETLGRERMVRPGGRVLVAVSGGSDSMALLTLFARHAADLRIELHVAHLDHGWRGATSARDAEFVRTRALQLGLPVTVGHVDAAAWKRAARRTTPSRRGTAGRRQSSLEARARTIRARFLRATARQVGADRIALGHTLDDQAESVLMRLLRGSGARGLGGIHPVVDRLFIRPLLGARRADLRAWLRRRGVRWREDATNLDLTLTRNRVRRRLVPILEKEFNPRAVPALARAAALLREDERWMDRMAGEAFAAAATIAAGRVSLDAAALGGMPEALRRRVVRRAIEAARGSLRGIGARHAEQALALLGRPGTRSLHLPSGLRVRSNGRRLSFEAAASNASDVHPEAAPGRACREALCPVPGAVRLPDFGMRLVARLAAPGEPVPAPGPDRALLDADRVAAPLVVRPRRPGDRFHPQGAPGTRRLKAFLIDRKVPVDERGRIPLVLSGEKIAWVVGHRIDDRFKITPATRRVLVLEKKETG